MGMGPGELAEKQLGFPLNSTCPGDPVGSGAVLSFTSLSTFFQQQEVADTCVGLTREHVYSQKLWLGPVLSFQSPEMLKSALSMWGMLFHPG